MRKEDVVGLDVFDSEGQKLGTVSDIDFALDSKNTLIITTEDEECKVKFEIISAISDVVLLKGKIKGKRK